MGEQNLRTMASRIDELPLELAPVGVLGHVDHIWVGGSACIELESPQTCRVTRSFVASVVGWRPDVEPNAID